MAVSPILGFTLMEQGQQDAYLISNEADLALESALARGYTAIINSDAADYVLSATDNGAYLRRTRATAQTVTVPESLAAGFTVHIRQAGIGSVSIVEDTSNVMLNAITPGSSSSEPAPTLRTQYSAVTLIRVAANEFDVIGDLEETS